MWGEKHKRPVGYINDITEKQYMGEWYVLCYLFSVVLLWRLSQLKGIGSKMLLLKQIMTHGEMNSWSNLKKWREMGGIG